MIFETNEQLQECCRYWQGVLHLQNWDVTCSFVRRNVMEDKARNGEVEYLSNELVAAIKVITVEDYNDKYHLSPYDPESILVHELVHLVWWHLGECHLAEEQSIAVTEKALLRLNRK